MIARIVLVNMPVHQNLTDLSGGHLMRCIMIRFREVMLQLVQGGTKTYRWTKSPAGQTSQSNSSKVHGIHRLIVREPGQSVKERPKTYCRS